MRKHVRLGKNAAAEHLVFDAIICSTMPRAIETAAIIASYLKFPVQNITRYPLLVEREWGELTGVSREAFLRDGHTLQDIDNWAGAESLIDLESRVTLALKLLKSLPSKRILVVGHGTFGRALLRVINHQPPSAEYEKGRQYLPNAQLIKIL